MNTPTLPGQPCQTSPRPEWTEPEKWVWQQVCEGKKADFNARYGELDPADPAGWSDNRLIGSVFLKTILLHEPFRSALPYQGVRILGAWVRDSVDLENAHLAHQWWLDKSRVDAEVRLVSLQTNDLVSFEGSVFAGSIQFIWGAKVNAQLNLSGAKITGTLDMDLLTVGSTLDLSGAKVAGKLNMSGLTVGSHLFMHNQAEFTDVNLTGAKVGNQLSLIGAKVTGTLNMNGIAVGSNLAMNKGVFARADLCGAKVSHIDLSSAKVTGTLNMNGLTVGSSLFMRNQAEFTDVDLTSAKVSNQLSLIGAKVTGTLNMNALEVGASLLMQCGPKIKSEFKDIDLGSAKVGQLELSGTKVKGKLNMNSLVVDGHLLMCGEAEFQDIDLIVAKVGGGLDLSSAKVKGKLNMELLAVDGDLVMRDGTFDKRIDLFFADFGGNLNLSGAGLAGMDLSGTHVRGELRLGSREHPAVQWAPGARLVLRNTRVGALQDRLEGDDGMGAWASELQMDGFFYDHLGGFLGSGDKADMLDRPVDWYRRWLARGPTFSPQPYEQLAKVLRATGHSYKANDVLYTSREREREQSWELQHYGKWLGFSLLSCTIGYGLGARYFRVLWWFAGITLIGFLFLLGSIEKSNWDLFKMAWASFDQVLPIVKLNEEHQKLILGNYSSWTIAYFYVQKLVGYVLGGFLGAGLAGLTQKN